MEQILQVYGLPLLGTRVNCDQRGHSLRAKPLHCILFRLTFAITPNVGDSGVLFLPHNTVTVIRILYKKTKFMIRSSNIVIDFFDIGTRVLQVHAFQLMRYCFRRHNIYNVPRFRTTNVSRSNKRNWFHIIKSKKQTISCRNNVMRRLHGLPAWTRSLQLSLEQTARVIGFYLNTDKTEFMSFKKRMEPSSF